MPGASSVKREYHFRNATARIASSALPTAARPIGYSQQPSPLPGRVDAKWFHASPSGFSRLWMYAQSEDAAKAAGSLLEQPQPRDASGPGGEGHPLVAFRHDFGGANAGATGGTVATVGAGSRWAHACRVVETVLRLSGATAALQLGSGAPPAELWRECAVLRRDGGAAAVAGVHQPGGPFVEESAAHGDAERPYSRHRVEWVPDY